jgi:arylsulfatase A-like enzyme/chitodextrinase
MAERALALKLPKAAGRKINMASVFKRPSGSTSLLTAIVVSSICLVASWCAHAQDEPTPPNFLVISIDDLKDIIGVLEDQPGNFLNTIYPDPAKRAAVRQILTPNIDRLADESVIFGDAHTIYPICNPSRIALWTGTRPLETGLDTNSYVSFRNRPGLADIVTMQQNLRENGYYTTGLGKVFHSPRGDVGIDEELSWDQWIHRLHGAKGPWIHSVYSSSTSTWPFGESPFPLEEQYDYLNADHAARLLESGVSSLPNFDSNNPILVELPTDGSFMIGLGIYLPHKPFVAPTEALALFDTNDMGLDASGIAAIFEDLSDLSDRGLFYASTNNSGSSTGAFTALLNTGLSRDGEGGDVNAWREMVKHYLASIVVADRSVGRVLDALDNGPYADNTVVVLHSDHGYQLGEKNVLGKNTLWDDSTRSVLMFRVPGVSAKRIEQTVSLQDLYPTVSSLAGLSTPEHVKYKDLSPMLASEEAISTQPVLSIQGRVESPRRAIITEQYRYIRFGTGLDDAELYDRYADPDDAVNLIDSPDYQHIRSTMDVLLENAVALEDGPPVLLPVLEQESAVGELVELPMSAWHALGDPISYEAESLPTGLSIHPSTGVISGIAETTGTYTSKVRALTEAGADTSTFDWIFDLDDVVAPVWSGGGSIDVATVGTRSIALEWSGATDDVGVVGYKVAYESSGAGISELLSNVPSVVLDSLNPDTEYTVKIEALDAAGNESDNGPTALLRTDIEDLGPPTWAVDVSVLATVTSSSSVSLAWPQASDDNGVAGYRVEYLRDGQSVSAVTSELLLALDTLSPDTEYTVSVVAWDILDKESLPIQVTFQTDPLPDTTAPVWSADATLARNNDDTNSLLISWPTAEDASQPVSYLATLLSTAGAELQSTSVTAKEVLFEGLLPDTSYRVSVQPTDSVGNESSDLLTAEYRTVEEIVDEAPVWGDATLSIVALSSTDVEIAWTGASDDNGVIDYLLTLTDLSAPGLPVRLASYPTTTALIDDLSAATDYLIEVQARDVASNVTTDGPSLTFRTEDIPIPADALSLTVDGEIRTASIESFSSQDRGPGAATLSSDGSSVSLEGNIWKRVRIDFDMTADTVLEFDFEGLVEGEVHGIGFETDNSPSSSVLIKLWGSERYGLRDLGTYSGEGVQRFRIPVGESFRARRYDWLTFVSDHDRTPRDASATFSNITISSTGVTEPDVSSPVWSSTTLAIDTVSSNSARLTWPTATDAGSAVSYLVWLNGELVSDTSETTFTLTTLDPETAYLVEVDAFDTAGNRSPRLSADLVTTPAPPPDLTAPVWTGSELIATLVDSTEVELQWPVATDDSNTVLYEVSIDGAVFTTISERVLSVDSLSPLTSYEFSVVAIDTSENRSTPLLAMATTEESLVPSNLLPVPGSVYASSSSNGSVSSVTFADEDIIVIDELAGTWKMLFDGSDVGLLGDVDAFVFRPDGQVLLSLDAPATVEGVGRIDDSDVLQFSPISLGDDTSGVFSMFLDGSDVGLTTAGEDINALALSSTGDLLISVSGRFNVDGLVAEDEDIVRFLATKTGDDTQGEWELFVDGSNVGYAGEDVWGMSWSDALSLTFQSAYTSPFGAVVPWDIMSVDVSATGSSIAGSILPELLFDGFANGVRYETLDAIHVAPGVPANET